MSNIKKANKKKAFINPVNYYNAFTKTEQFLSDLPVLSISGGKSGNLVDNNGCVYKPVNDVPGHYRLEGDPSHPDLEDGHVYGKFDLLQTYKFKGNFNATATYVSTVVMDAPWPYILVGNDIYKIVRGKSEWGGEKMDLKPYKRETVSLLETKSGIERTKDKFFEGFCVIPDNKNHVEIDGNCFNLYRPFQHKSHSGEVRADDVSYTLSFFKHIFGDQLQLGLQYFKILYEYPKQMLPVLVLVSKDRHTGKTTFLDYLSMVFGDNFVQLMASDIMGDFNAHYAYANIMGIDETIVDKVHAVEKVKSLVTSRRILVNDKFIKSYTLPYFGKIVMTSNKVTDFMKVDSEEIRFWVRKLTSFGKVDPKFFDKINSEIPMFLKYVETNVMMPEYKSRMVFSPQQIENEHLIAVKEESKSSLCKDIEMRVEEHLLNNIHIDKIQATANDIKRAWYQHDSKITLSYIRKTLKDELTLLPSDPIRYESRLTYPIESNMGRVYTFERGRFVGGEQNQTGQTPSEHTQTAQTVPNKIQPNTPFLDFDQNAPF